MKLVFPAHDSWMKPDAILPFIGAAMPTHVELESRLHFPVAIAPASIRFPIEWVTTMVSAILDFVLVLLTASARSQTCCCCVLFVHVLFTVSRTAYLIDVQHGAWSVMLPQYGKESWLSGNSVGIPMPWMKMHGRGVDLHEHEVESPTKNQIPPSVVAFFQMSLVSL